MGGGRSGGGIRARERRLEQLQRFAGGIGEDRRNFHTRDGCPARSAFRLGRFGGRKMRQPEKKNRPRTHGMWWSRTILGPVTVRNLLVVTGLAITMQYLDYRGALG